MVIEDFFFFFLFPEPVGRVLVLGCVCARAPGGKDQAIGRGKEGPGASCNPLRGTLCLREIDKKLPKRFNFII